MQNNVYSLGSLMEYAMQDDEWLEVAAAISDHWPYHPWPPNTVAASWPILRQLSKPTVMAALEVIVREGNPFPPTAGQILVKATELAIDAPDWGLAWLEIRKEVAAGRDIPRITTFVVLRRPGGDAELKAVKNEDEADETIASVYRRDPVWPKWLRESIAEYQAAEDKSSYPSPLVTRRYVMEDVSGYKPVWSHSAIGQLVEQVTWKSLVDVIRGGTPTDLSVFESRCRTRYESIVRAEQERLMLTGMENTGGLRRLDRIAAENVLKLPVRVAE